MVTRLEVGPERIRIRRLRSDALLIAILGLTGALVLLWLTLAGTLTPVLSLLPLLLTLSAFWFGLDTLRQRGREEVCIDFAERVMLVKRCHKQGERVPLAEIECLDISNGIFHDLLVVRGEERVLLCESFAYSPRIMKFVDHLSDAGVPLSPTLDFLLNRRGKAWRMAVVMILFLWLAATLTWFLLR